MSRLPVRPIARRLLKPYASHSAYSTKPQAENTKPGLCTDHFQASLPRLRVPALDKTLERYINSQKAVLDTEQLRHTEKIVAKFRVERGPELQRELEHYANTHRHTSYITSMWSDMYLRDRRPVVLTHNPLIVLKDSTLGSGYQKPAIRATNLLHHLVEFCRLLRTNLLEPEVFHLNPEKSKTPRFNQIMRFVPRSVATYAAYFFNAYPLDMSQYPLMFNTTRLPEPEKDRLLTDPSARHIVVIHHGQLYVFNVFDVHGNPVPPKQILSNINFILSRPPVPSAPGLGVITTMNRDDAYSARERLLALNNKSNLKLVDTALIALILDEEPMADLKEMLLNFLAGPSQSRWFDKSISLLVNGAGHAAVNFEHSWGDGVAVVRLCDDMYQNSESKPVVTAADLLNSNTSLPSPDVRRLEWLLDDHIQNEMLIPAREKYDAWRRSVILHFVEKHDRLTRSLCKAANVGGDAMIQLCFQLAYNILNEQPASTYESCSTAAFKHGRTETMRPATVETRAFVDLMRCEQGVVTSGFSDKPAAGAVTQQQLQKALDDCSKKHGILTKEAAMGQGWDRHLFALKHFAQEQLGRTLPELFLDENYEFINRHTLSTSTLASPNFAAGGFAAVDRDGYGVGYRLMPDSCGACVTSWKDSPRVNAAEFCDALNISIDRIAALLQLRISEKST
ncbi:carnitine O-palmitoyltransferase 2 [Clonorchis sinensis]|uniref:Carnitine O-palmitoyltransferase 2 n=1 Tax=Clonorchis sinensis TaxID=79923 RepID=G7YWR8_CLOSI|nr:carnitine O-palmitoyltransferase 2 [Clonorchis sinensis]